MTARSIRISLMVRIGVGIGMLLLILSTWIYLTVRHGLYKELDNAITQTAALLSNQIELENGAIIFEWQEGLGTNRKLIDDGLFQFWDEATGLTTRSPGLQAHNLPKFSGLGGAPLVKDISLPESRHHARAIGLRVYPYNAPENAPEPGGAMLIDPKTRPHILVVARGTKSVLRVLNRVRWILGIGTVVAMAGLYFLIDRVIRVALRPINDLANQISNRTSSQLDSPLEVPEHLPVELHGLAADFDILLGRMAMARVRERDFIRHAAHELRTPIAGLRAVTDLALSQPRSAADYERHMVTCQRTAIELTELVSRFTALSRVGQARGAVELTRLDISRILSECLAPFFEQPSEHAPRLDIELEADEIYALGDEYLLRIIFKNLLENALCYTNIDGEVSVKMGVAGESIRVTFSNTVSKVPECMERLFEPLFREEPSRHDAQQHLGIGLTLCRDAAAAMDSKLTASSPAHGRIEFILTLRSQ